MSTRRKPLVLAAAATAVAVLAGFALAQAAIGEDPTQLGNGLLVLLTAGAVAWFRDTPIGQRVDGKVTVTAFAMLAGGALAVGFETVGLLGFSPFVEALGRWWGAAAAGLIVGAEAVFGVSLYKYGARALKRDSETGKITIDPTALGDLTTGLQPAAQAKPPATAVAFILDTAKMLLGREPLGAALTALYPLITQYAQDPAVLTDDLRAKIQTQVLEALRAAGLTGVDLGQDPIP